MSGIAEPSSAATAVVRLYRLLLDREPDEAGLSYHVGLLERSADILDVVAALTASPEFFARRNPEDVVSAPRPEPTVTIDRAITVVDVGAQRLSDQPHAYTVLETAGFELKVVGFEPLSERLEDRSKAEADSNLRLLPDFIGDGSKQTFHINNYDATSSLLPFNRNLTDAFVELKDLHTVRTEMAATRRIDDVLSGSEPVDFLKLDIQGFELKALQGAETLLQRTAVIHCEVSFAEIYEGQCLFSEIETFLRARGFDFIDFMHAHRGGYVVPSGTVIGDRLLWADAVFFRHPEALDAASRSIQAMIAWHVYGKLGLAERLLTT
ncbi:FkbM family methyltransferase [Methylobacterium sp. WL103]|uniref:FkbM family methyltransferase n=1 Tax=Methylobacterium sp. WL103 TaxID=2603891 RepID=UPI001AEE0DC9|nr:FkbM family methyltransferase [Methylobacterium sp. WL103]